MLLPSKWKFAPNFMFPGCPCCTGGTCGTCTLASLTWRITLSGIADGTGSNCTEFNGTHDLTVDEPLSPADEGCQLTGGCFALANMGIFLRFSTSVVAPFQIIGITLWFFNNTTCTLGIGQTTVARYALSASVACSTSSIVVDRTSAQADCTGFPATITMTAV